MKYSYGCLLVLTRVGERQQVVDIIRNRQRRWLGHTLGHGDILTIVMERRIKGKRPPGRLRIGRQKYKDFYKNNGNPDKKLKKIIMGAFFWDYFSYFYSDLRITEYTEYKFPKKRSCRMGPKKTRLPSIRSIPVPE